METLHLDELFVYGLYHNRTNFRAVRVSGDQRRGHQRGRMKGVGGWADRARVDDTNQLDENVG